MLSKCVTFDVIVVSQYMYIKSLVDVVRRRVMNAVIWCV